jgi:hypothetical protein
MDDAATGCRGENVNMTTPSWSRLSRKSSRAQAVFAVLSPIRLAVPREDIADLPNRIAATVLRFSLQVTSHNGRGVGSDVPQLIPVQCQKPKEETDGEEN